MSFFAFTLNIPSAPDDPADDQPIMQINNNSIFGWAAVDHVGFNVANTGGYHNKVTFIPNAATGPGIGNGIGVMFANATIPNTGFTSTAFPYWQNASQILPFVMGSPIVAGTQVTPTVNAVNGIISLGGIIFQWQTTTIAPNATVAITFTKAFNTAYNVQVTGQKTGTGGDGVFVQTGTLSATGFTAINASSTITSIFIFAIGK
jgi:hypothetical protein